MWGFETFRKAYAQTSSVPIVVLSGSDDEGLHHKRGAGKDADFYLVKGQVDSHLLARAIRYAIERERGRKERLQLLAREQAARADAVQAEQRFHDILQGLHAIVWEADAQTWQFTFVSQRAADILGYPVEQWLTQPDFSVHHIHPEDRQHSVAYCQRSTPHKGWIMSSSTGLWRPTGVLSGSKTSCMWCTVRGPGAAATWRDGRYHGAQTSGGGTRRGWRVSKRPWLISASGR